MRHRNRSNRSKTLLLCVICLFLGSLAVVNADWVKNITRVIITSPDGTDLQIESNGGVPVNIQDQTTAIVDFHLIREEGMFNLSANTNIDDLTFNATTGHGITAGEMVELYEDGQFFQAEALNVSTNVITLDTPLDKNFTTNAIGRQGDYELNLDGSSTMIVSSVTPKYMTNISWDITRLLIVMEDGTSPDTSRFGGIVGGLTNGVVIRSKNGITKNVFNAKSNGDFASHSFDVQYDDRAQGQGLFAVRVRSTFAGQDKRGVTIRLDSETDDEFQVLIQDDLTQLTTFNLIAQGHIVTD